MEKSKSGLQTSESTKGSSDSNVVDIIILGSILWPINSGTRFVFWAILKGRYLSQVCRNWIY